MARIRFKTLVLTFRAVNGTASTYINSLFQPYTPTHHLRSSADNRLVGCQVKLEEALLFVLGLIMWSSLAVVVVEVVGFVSVAQLMRDQPLLEYRILDRD